MRVSARHPCLGAQRSLNGVGLAQVERADGDKDVHAAAPRMDETGLDLDELPDPNGPVEVKVADGGGDAAAPTPR